MLCNIIDRRNRKYRFRKINAVVEATWHDNRCKDSDHIASNRGKDGPDYEEKEHTNIPAAIRWAQSFKTWVTLYLYDSDGGIYPAKIKRRKVPR